MAKYMFSILLVAAIFRGAKPGSPPGVLAAGPEITITNNGLEYSYTEDQNDLVLTTNLTKVCKTGVWVAHSGKNYGYNEPLGVTELYPSLEYTCYYPFISKIRSLRFAGSRNNYSAPSVTLFTKSGSAGMSFTLAEGEGIANIEPTFHGMITISTQAEFFQEAAYKGDSICYEVDPTRCWGEVCWESAFNSVHLPWDPTFANSVKAGCRSTTSVYRATATTYTNNPTVIEYDNTDHQAKFKILN